MILTERPPPPDDGPRKDICAVCGGIVLVYTSMGIMHHDDDWLDINHLARINEEI